MPGGWVGRRVRRRFIEPPANYLERGTEKSPRRAIAGIPSRRIASWMKNKLLRRTIVNLAVVSLFSLLGACAATTTANVSKPRLTASRDSSGPVRNPDIIDGGTRIPVETYYDWPPLGDRNPQ